VRKKITISLDETTIATLREWTNADGWKPPISRLIERAVLTCYQTKASK
jgi:hypothetical protein